MGFPSVEELAGWIGRADDEAVRALHARAYAVKDEVVGRRVSMRGLIEAGNVCAKDCRYCGIRRSNMKVARYRLSKEEIVSCARFAAESGYGSVVIQSGEIEGEEHTRFIEAVLRAIAPLQLGVTLSLGEQSEEAYRCWHDAGATRYLLRIETSNPDLYAAIHPPSCSFVRRVECLRALRRCGYQVGTGVMVGLPGQTLEDLARDIVFFRDIDADMIGMGPYIPHPDTPLAAEARDWSAERALRLGLNMIAAARIALRDVNIAAATALQALDPLGREKGLLAGANVVMPNITDVKYRAQYKLYAGKPCLDESAVLCRSCLQRRIKSIGETVLWGVPGDSAHFFARQNA